MDKKRNKDSRHNKIHVAMRLAETMKDLYVAGNIPKCVEVITHYNNVTRSLKENRQ